MGLDDCTFIFGMELNTYKPFVCRNLYNFSQACLRIHTCGEHACFFKYIPVFAVKFIAMAMPFHNFLLAVGCVSFGAWF